MTMDKIENTNTKPEKVAVLGGGMSALTAAFALSDPSLAGQYDITVYQMGWRLGGKGASGRNADIHQRIEEHGLHIWFGFYDNAFTVMRQCYKEIVRPDPAPLATFDKAFKVQNYYILHENIDGEWRPWYLEFPENDLKPGGHPSVWGFVQILIGWVYQIIKDRPWLHKSVAVVDHHHSDDEGLLLRLEHVLSDLLHKGEADIMSMVGQIKDIVSAIGTDHRNIKDSDTGPIADSLTFLARLIWFEIKDKVEAGDDEYRRAWILIYMGITSARGMLEDGIITKGFDVINDLEFRQWLYKHAAFDNDEEGNPNRVAYESAPLRTFYDAAFAFANGDVNTPNMAAGVALRGILRIAFSYKKSIIFEMQAGMGDTVFTPLYLALLARGVKFEFFNRVENLKLSEDNKSISSIDISRQINLKNGRYNPLINVKDLQCWPSEPLYNQIVEGEELRDAKVNLSHYADDWNDTGGKFTLDAGEDFDHVVLGIALPSLKETCGELIAASPAWQSMISNVTSTRTQAFQLWFNQTRQQMGLPGPPAIIGSYVEPWSSITDFSHLLSREAWPQSANVGFLTYSCGAMLDTAPSEQIAADAYVFKKMKSFLESDIQPIWPGACSLENPPEIEWSLLWAPDGVCGSDRLKSQYWRANVDTTELFILTVAGSVQYRLKSGESGFSNLVLAGDWTNNGFNIGSIESTALSGLQAARAISGFPKNIVGETDF